MLAMDQFATTQFGHKSSSHSSSPPSVSDERADCTMDGPLPSFENINQQLNTGTPSLRMDGLTGNPRAQSESASFNNGSIDGASSGSNKALSYRVVRRMCEESPNATLFLCEHMINTSTQLELVVVKVGRQGSHMSNAPSQSFQTQFGGNLLFPSQELRLGADSIQQECTVASRLIEAGTQHAHIVQFRSITSTQPFQTMTRTTNADEANQANKADRANDANLADANQADAIDAINAINAIAIVNQNTDDLVVLVMEYCPRGDLFSLLEQQPDFRFHETEALHLFRQVVSGVHHLHTMGIAHLDLSLENVLLNAHGVAKICDFGLSAFFEIRREGRRSMCSGTVGKLQYMAPEVACGGEYDPVCADVWSLGMVLFMLVTGSPLFQVALPSDPAWDAVEKVGIRGVLRHWKLDGVLSEGTVDLLCGMLQLDASLRLQSLETVLGSLR